MQSAATLISAQSPKWDMANLSTEIGLFQVVSRMVEPTIGELDRLTAT
jgi:hypothetical protein